MDWLYWYAGLGLLVVGAFCYADTRTEDPQITAVQYAAWYFIVWLTWPLLLVCFAIYVFKEASKP